MAAYDPKRPRPASSSDPDEAPPVDALLDPPPVIGEPGDAATPDDAAVPDEAVVPDDAAMPDDAVSPDDAAVPDDAAMPDDAVSPDDAAVPDDAAMPDDAVSPDDAAVPDDAVSPDVGAGGAAPPEPLQTSESVVDEVDLRAVASTNGNGSRPVAKRSAEVPIATAPEEGTANRAVLIAALVAASVVALLVALLVRRRRHSV